jgi:hypothetical protein
MVVCANVIRVGQNALVYGFSKTLRN